MSQVFRLHVSGIFDSRHFHDGQLTARHRLLHPQDLGMEMSHSLRLRALRQSPSTRWRSCRTRGFTTFDMSRSHGDCAQSSRVHSWSTRKTQLRLSLPPPHSELLPTRQREDRQASRTKTKSTVGSSRIPTSRCLRSRPTIGCATSSCCWTIKHLGLPFRNRTRCLRACMFFGIRAGASVSQVPPPRSAASHLS